MRYFQLIILLLVISACQTVTVDVSHVKTDKGFLNSSLGNLGDLYLFDTSTLKVDKLANVNLTKIKTGFSFNNIKAVDLQGVDIRGNLDATIKAQVELEIANKSFIELEKGKSIEYEETFNALSKRINREISRGRNLGFSWFLDEATEPNSSLRYLLVYGAVLSEKAKIGFDSSLVTGGKIEIPTGRFGSLTIKVSGSSVEEFEGEAIPVFLKIFAIQAFKDKNTGNYKFRIDRNFDSSKLTSSLRRK